MSSEALSLARSRRATPPMRRGNGSEDESTDRDRRQPPSRWRCRSTPGKLSGMHGLPQIFQVVARRFVADCDCFWIFRETRANYLEKLRRQCPIDVGEWFWCVSQYRREDRKARVTLEWPLADGHFGQHHAERERCLSARRRFAPRLARETCRPQCQQCVLRS